MRYFLDKSPLPEPYAPVACHWCGGSFARLRNVYKGKDSERYYDSAQCLTAGEDRAIRYRATLAGQIS